MFERSVVLVLLVVKASYAVQNDNSVGRQGVVPVLAAGEELKLSNDGSRLIPLPQGVDLGGLLAHINACPDEAQRSFRGLLSGELRTNGLSGLVEVEFHLGVAGSPERFWTRGFDVVGMGSAAQTWVPFSLLVDIPCNSSGSSRYPVQILAKAFSTDHDSSASLHFAMRNIVITAPANQDAMDYLSPAASDVFSFIKFTRGRHPLRFPLRKGPHMLDALSGQPELALAFHNASPLAYQCKKRGGSATRGVLYLEVDTYFGLLPTHVVLADGPRESITVPLFLEDTDYELLPEKRGIVLYGDLTKARALTSWCAIVWNELKFMSLKYDPSLHPEAPDFSVQFDIVSLQWSTSMYPITTEKLLSVEEQQIRLAAHKHELELVDAIAANAQASSLGHSATPGEDETPTEPSLLKQFPECVQADGITVRPPGSPCGIQSVECAPPAVCDGLSPHCPSPAPLAMSVVPGNLGITRAKKIDKGPKFVSNASSVNFQEWRLTCGDAWLSDAILPYRDDVKCDSLWSQAPATEYASSGRTGVFYLTGDEVLTVDEGFQHFHPTQLDWDPFIPLSGANVSFLLEDHCSCISHSSVSFEVLILPNTSLPSMIEMGFTNSFGDFTAYFKAHIHEGLHTRGGHGSAELSHWLRVVAPLIQVSTPIEEVNMMVLHSTISKTKELGALAFRRLAIEGFANLPTHLQPPTSFAHLRRNTARLWPSNMEDNVVELFELAKTFEEDGQYSFVIVPDCLAQDPSTTSFNAIQFEVRRPFHRYFLKQALVCSSGEIEPTACVAVKIPSPQQQQKPWGEWQLVEAYSDSPFAISDRGTIALSFTAEAAPGLPKSRHRASQTYFDVRNIGFISGINWSQWKKVSRDVLESGTFSVPMPSLAPGQYTYAAVLTSATGTSTPPVCSDPFVVDTSPPDLSQLYMEIPLSPAEIVFHAVAVRLRGSIIEAESPVVGSFSLNCADGASFDLGRLDTSQCLTDCDTTIWLPVHPAMHVSPILQCEIRLTLTNAAELTSAISTPVARGSKPKITSLETKVISDGLVLTVYYLSSLSQGYHKAQIRVLSAGLGGEREEEEVEEVLVVDSKHFSFQLHRPPAGHHIIEVLLCTYLHSCDIKSEHVIVPIQASLALEAKGKKLGPSALFAADLKPAEIALSWDCDDSTCATLCLCNEETCLSPLFCRKTCSPSGLLLHQLLTQAPSLLPEAHVGLQCPGSSSFVVSIGPIPLSSGKRQLAAFPSVTCKETDPSHRSIVYQISWAAIPSSCQKVKGYEVCITGPEQRQCVAATATSHTTDIHLPHAISRSHSAVVQALCHHRELSALNERFSSECPPSNNNHPATFSSVHHSVQAAQQRAAAHSRTNAAAATTRTARLHRSRQLVDITPPVAGAVFDGLDVGLDINHVSVDAAILGATWTGFLDLESGISNIQWSIRTSDSSVGAANVLQWTTVSSTAIAAWVSIDDLSQPLQEGVEYVTDVTATNTVGDSTTSSSDGFAAVGAGYSVNNVAIVPLFIASQPTLARDACACLDPYADYFTAHKECLCKPQYYLGQVDGRSECMLCPDGTCKYNYGNELSACRTCSGGSDETPPTAPTYTSCGVDQAIHPTTSDCVCAPGFYRGNDGSCTRCPRFTHKTDPGDGISLCTSCGLLSSDVDVAWISWEKPTNVNPIEYVVSMDTVANGDRWRFVVPESDGDAGFFEVLVGPSYLSGGSATLWSQLSQGSPFSSGTKLQVSISPVLPGEVAEELEGVTIEVGRTDAAAPFATRLYPPQHGTLNDGLSLSDQDVQVSTSTLSAAWHSWYYPDSEIEPANMFYSVAYGTSPFTADVSGGWIEVDNDKNHTLFGANLCVDCTYYATLRVYHPAGSFVEVASDGVTVAAPLSEFSIVILGDGALSQFLWVEHQQAPSVTNSGIPTFRHAPYQHSLRGLVVQWESAPAEGSLAYSLGVLSTAAVNSSASWVAADSNSVVAQVRAKGYGWVLVPSTSTSASSFLWADEDTEVNNLVDGHCYIAVLLTETEYGDERYDVSQPTCVDTTPPTLAAFGLKGLVDPSGSSGTASQLLWQTDDSALTVSWSAMEDQSPLEELHVSIVSVPRQSALVGRLSPNSLPLLNMNVPLNGDVADEGSRILVGATMEQGRCYSAFGFCKNAAGAVGNPIHSTTAVCIDRTSPRGRVTWGIMSSDDRSIPLVWSSDSSTGYVPTLESVLLQPISVYDSESGIANVTITISSADTGATLSLNLSTAVAVEGSTVEATPGSASVVWENLMLGPLLQEVGFDSKASESWEIIVVAANTVGLQSNISRLHIYQLGESASLNFGSLALNAFLGCGVPEGLPSGGDAAIVMKIPPPLNIDNAPEASVSRCQIDDGSSELLWVPLLHIPALVWPSVDFTAFDVPEELHRVFDRYVVTLQQLGAYNETLKEWEVAEPQETPSTLYDGKGNTIPPTHIAHFPLNERTVYNIEIQALSRLGVGPTLESSPFAVDATSPVEKQFCVNASYMGVDMALAISAETLAVSPIVLDATTSIYISFAGYTDGDEGSDIRSFQVSLGFVPSTPFTSSVDVTPTILQQGECSGYYGGEANIPVNDAFLLRARPHNTTVYAIITVTDFAGNRNRFSHAIARSSEFPLLAGEVEVVGTKPRMEALAGVTDPFSFVYLYQQSTDTVEVRWTQFADVDAKIVGYSVRVHEVSSSLAAAKSSFDIIPDRIDPPNVNATDIIDSAFGHLARDGFTGVVPVAFVDVDVSGGDIQTVDYRPEVPLEHVTSSVSPSSVQYSARFNFQDTTVVKHEAHFLVEVTAYSDSGNVGSAIAQSILTIDETKPDIVGFGDGLGTIEFPGAGKAISPEAAVGEVTGGADDIDCQPRLGMTIELDSPVLNMGVELLLTLGSVVEEPGNGTEADNSTAPAGSNSTATTMTSACQVISKITEFSRLNAPDSLKLRKREVYALRRSDPITAELRGCSALEPAVSQFDSIKSGTSLIPDGWEASLGSDFVQNNDIMAVLDVTMPTMPYDILQELSITLSTAQTTILATHWRQTRDVESGISDVMVSFWLEGEEELLVPPTAVALVTRVQALIHPALPVNAVVGATLDVSNGAGAHNIAVSNGVLLLCSEGEPGCVFDGRILCLSPNWAGSESEN